MEPQILEEVQKHYQQEVIDFNWEPVRKNPKRYGVLYPIIGYFVSLVAIRFIPLGVFMWLLLIGGSILFFGGVYCANGMMGEYKKMAIQKEVEDGGHC
jgi:VIT1/CCC1 family predicted Fe2+/Mn2+ transporter